MTVSRTPAPPLSEAEAQTAARFEAAEAAEESWPAFREQWIADGFPWCDTCRQAAVFSEFYGNLHATSERRFGLYPHEDPADHPITMRDWADAGRARRSSS